MNYHIEHHMYASVPFHRLPDLHRTITHDLPEPVKGFFHGFMHITKLVSRQRKDPQWVYIPQLPATASPARMKVK